MNGFPCGLIYGFRTNIGGVMKKMLDLVYKVSDWMDNISVVALSFLMAITVADVIGRAVGKPFPGTFEIVGLLGAIVIGFALPLTTWKKSHVCLDFLVEKFPEGRRNVLLIFTRIMGILLFLLFGISLMMLSKETYLSGEVSLTMKLPTYLFMFATSICCFVESLLLCFDIVRIVGGYYE
jgi:TRAP-type C4-dicarboxylate transport system permease small subunit